MVDRSPHPQGPLRSAIARASGHSPPPVSDQPASAATSAPWDGQIPAANDADGFERLLTRLLGSPLIAEERPDPVCCYQQRHLAAGIEVWVIDQRPYFAGCYIRTSEALVYIERGKRVAHGWKRWSRPDAPFDWRDPLGDTQATHRLDGPADIRTWTDGRREERWYQHGELARADDGPVHTIRRADGVLIEMWYQDRVPHRIGQPAIVLTRPDGSRVETFIERGKLRQDRQIPGRRTVLPDGRIVQPEWPDEPIVREEVVNWICGFRAEADGPIVAFK